MNPSKNYIALTEGRMSRAEFLRQARQAFPNLIGAGNNFDDALKILTRRGLINEELVYQNKADKFPLESIERGIRYELEVMDVYDIHHPSQEQYKKARQRAIDNLCKDPLYYINKIAEPVEQPKQEDTEGDLKKVTPSKKNLQEDLFRPHRGLEGDDVITVDPRNFYQVLQDIKAGKYDNIAQDSSKWNEDHIDVAAQNMDVASDIYYSIENALETRANSMNGLQESRYITEEKSGIRTNWDEKKLKIAYTIYKFGNQGINAIIDKFGSMMDQGLGYGVGQVGSDGNNNDALEDIAAALCGCTRDALKAYAVKRNDANSYLNTQSTRGELDPRYERIQNQYQNATSPEEILNSVEYSQEEIQKNCVNARQRKSEIDGGRKDREAARKRSEAHKSKELYQIRQQLIKQLGQEKGLKAYKRYLEKHPEFNGVRSLEEAPTEDNIQLNKKFFDLYVKYKDGNYQVKDKETGELRPGKKLAPETAAQKACMIIRKQFNAPRFRPDRNTIASCSVGRGKLQYQGERDGIPSFNYAWSLKEATKTVSDPLFNQFYQHFVKKYKDAGDPNAELKARKDAKGALARYKAKQMKEQQEKSILKEHIIGIIGKVLNEAATANLAQLSDENASVAELPGLINSLENIVTEIESFWIKEQQKIQGVFDQVGNIKNEDGLPVGYKFVQPMLESLKKDLEPVLAKITLDDLKLPEAPAPDQTQVNDPNAVPPVEPKQTVFSPAAKEPLQENKKNKRYTK